MKQKIISVKKWDLRRVLQRLKQLPWKKIGITAAAVLSMIFLLSVGTVWYLIATAPDIDTITVSPTESATWICDENGNYLRTLTLSDTNRDIVSLENIPETLINAVIAIEDSRFYEHNGIDPRGILRAAWNGITNGSFSEGASTITQQLIKNNVFTEWTQENSFADRFRRKIQEQYLAVQLEKRMSKEEILESYLNTINFGAGCYGVQTAAHRYFGKDVSDLSLSESAVLAAIPQNPTGNNPIDFPDTNQNRQQLILIYMQEQGYITQEELQSALADNVYTRISSYNASWEDEPVYTYYEDALISQVTDLLISELGYSSEQAYRAVYSGGLRIFSAQDEALQQICDEEFQNAANFPADTQYGIDYALSIEAEDGSVTHYGSAALRTFIRSTRDASFDLLCSSEEEAQSYADAFRESILSENASSELLAERLSLSPQPQASLVLIEQQTGFVRALVGGRGEKTASLTLNRATDTTRQPGSTFKILTAYAPALDACGQTLATLYENEPFEYEDGTPVSNWDITDYTGIVTIREAITRSINVAAVRCITEITPRVGFTYAEKFGISTLVDSQEMENGFSDVIQPLALGGITNGVTNLELCAAYASIANGGLYGEPLFFTKILDRNGNVILDFSDRCAHSTEQTDTTLADGQTIISDDAENFHTLQTSAQNTEESSPGAFTRVLQESTAFLLTSAMQDVVSSADGTAYGSVSAAGLPVAGKTGTTSNYKDIWFVGYTPYYTCCVWGGYDNNQDLPAESTCHTYSRILWSAVMDRIHSGLPTAQFTQPDDIEIAVLCSESHLLAQENDCPSTYTEYFAAGTAPETICTLHEPIQETEPNVIYQDLLEQLLPETTETEESTAEAESDEETENRILYESETGGEDKADSENDPNEESPSDSEDGLSEDGHSDSESHPASENESNISPASEADETSSLEDILERLSGQGFSLS